MWHDPVNQSALKTLCIIQSSIWSTFLYLAWPWVATLIVPKNKITNQISDHANFFFSVLYQHASRPGTILRRVWKTQCLHLSPKFRGRMVWLWSTTGKDRMHLPWFMTIWDTMIIWDKTKILNKPQDFRSWTLGKLNLAYHSHAYPVSWCKWACGSSTSLWLSAIPHKSIAE